MILVTGATGFVGRHVVRRLKDRPARAMVRGGSSPRFARSVEVVEADLTEAESLTPALAGVQTVIHAAAITGDVKEPYRGAYDAINREGTENLVAAAQKAGVERLVVVSGLGTKPASPGSYMATRQGLEEAVRRCGIPYVILQPSVLFGDGAPFIERLADLARLSPLVPVLGGGDLRFQPLWIEDLVRCLIQATDDRDLDNRTLALGGAEYVTLREIQQAISQVLGKRRLLVPLPLPVARLQAGLMTALLPRPPLTPAVLDLFDFENATALDAVEKAFGFRPRGFREHLAAHGLEG
jgi:NADH dehydrogenase